MTAAGQYKVDLTSQLTVLQMNSMYFAFDDKSTHAGEQSTILTWLENELSLAK
jgi:hypothetical protein